MTNLVNQRDDDESDDQTDRIFLPRVSGDGEEDRTAGDGVLRGAEAFEWIDEERREKSFDLQQRNAEGDDNCRNDAREKSSQTRRVAWHCSADSQRLAVSDISETG